MDRQTNPLAWGASTAVVECFQLLQACAYAVIVSVSHSVWIWKAGAGQTNCVRICNFLLSLGRSEFCLKVSKIVKEKRTKKKKSIATDLTAPSYVLFFG